MHFIDSDPVFQKKQEGPLLSQKQQRWPELLMVHLRQQECFFTH